MNEDLYEALEVCLQALERGADLEACLALFPALADELRPILETATLARAQAVHSADVPPAAVRRGRTRVLQHAAEMRERERTASLPFWQRAPRPLGRTFRALAVSLTALVFFFSGSTGLVFASSNALPGDSLYPVKRGWEGVQLALIVDPAVRMQRETEFEHERVAEIHGLFSESRKTRVEFQGTVESQEPGILQVSGLRIAVDHDATFKGQIFPGALVQVIGETDDGIIEAEQVILLQPGPATQTPTATTTPRPQKTPTLHPTQRPSETEEPRETQEPKETKEPTETLEPRETEKPDHETPEPKETDSNKKPTKEPTDDHGGEGGGGGGGGGGDDN